MDRPPPATTTRTINAVLALVAVAALAAYAWMTLSDDATLLRSARRAMVASQIRERGVTDEAVLEAMTLVPRHRFVPLAQRPLAYEDRPLPIGHGQTISQPYVVALMTELLHPRRGLRVLEVGTGSGYQAAVLAQLGCRVFSIEIVPELAREAAATLSSLGYDVQVRQGDGYGGWPDEAPFDAVIVTCAPDAIPRALVEQLREGGRMIIPVGPQDRPQTLTLVTKREGQPVTEEILSVSFVPMVHGPGSVTP